MTQQELRAKIESVASVLREEITKPGATPEDAKFATVAIIGVELIGEMLIDLKRIAEALE